MVLAELWTERPDRIRIHSQWQDKELVKRVPGARWDTQYSTWTVPLSWPTCITLRGIFGDRLEVGPDLIAWSWNERERRITPALDLREALESPTPHDEANLHDTQLYPYQRAGRDFLINARYALLGDEMGSGKTFQVIAALRQLHNESEFEQSRAYPALVICPNTVKRNWEAEIRQWAPEAHPIVITGTIAQRRKLLKQAKDIKHAVVIINIEALRTMSRLAPYGSIRLKRCIECGGTDTDVTTSKCEVHSKELQEFDFQVVVVDEAHRIKDPKAKQTRAVWAVAHGSTQTRHRWTLTGTPIANDPSDLWPILHTIDPQGFPNKGKFLDRYALKGFNAFGGMDIIGLNPATRDEFMSILDPYFRRMLKAVVLPYLPPKIRTTRSVDMSPRQKRVYDELESKMVSYLDDGSPLIASNNLAAATRLLQLSSTYCKVDTSDDPDDPARWRVELSEPSPKIDELLEVIAENEGHSIAVAAEHRQLLELASTRLAKHGIKHGMITGGVSESERAEALEAFQDGRIKVMLFTYKAGGVGLNMTKADLLVRMQRSWSMIDNVQGENRVHRVGSEQHESVTIVDLIAEGTIEHVQLERLVGKMRRMEEIVRDREQLAAQGLDTTTLDSELQLIQQSHLGES